MSASLAAAMVVASLLAAEPVRSPEAGGDVRRILAQDRYSFCVEGNDYQPSPADLRWCELLDANEFERCPGYVEICARGAAELELTELSEGGTGYEEQEQTPGEANQGAYEERESFALPDLGGFAKLLMWLLLLGGVAALVVVIAKNLIRDRDRDEPDSETEDPGAGESLVAARAAAMRVVETDVQRLLARAEQAAGRGDYGQAIADVYAALLRRLEGEQLISVEHWKTNGDYVGQLRGRPALRDEVREIVREVEQVQFGAAAPEPHRYVDIRTKILAVVGRATLAFTVLLGASSVLGCPLFEGSGEGDLPDSGALAGLGTGPADQRAIAELLLVHGIEARHRTRSIDELAGGSKAIVLLEDVELLEQDWDTLIRWIEDDGGTLVIATGLEFPRELGVDYQTITAVTNLEADPNSYFLGQLELVAPAGKVLDSSNFVEVLATRGPDLAAEPWTDQSFDNEVREPYVVSRIVGEHEGRVIVFAEPDLWTNVGISVADNGAFLLDVLLSYDISKVEFVDHYTGSGPDDPFESMANAKLGGLFLQILLFLALLYAAVGIPFARLRDPARQRRRSFVEHVQTLGQRYAQARASRYVAGRYSSWALDRLRERLLPSTGRGLLPLAQAIAARTGRDEASVMRLLVAAHELREESEHSVRGTPSDLELMRQLARLLDEIGGAR